MFEPAASSNTTPFGSNNPGTASKRSAGRRIRDPCLAGRAPRSGARRGTRRRPPAPSASLHGRGPRHRQRRILQRRAPPPSSLRDATSAPTSWGGGQAAAVGSATAAAVTAPRPRHPGTASKRSAGRRIRDPCLAGRAPRSGARRGPRRRPPAPPAPLHGRGRRHRQRRILQRRPPSVVASRRHLRPHFVGWRTGSRRVRDRRHPRAASVPSSSRNGVQAQRRTTYPGSMPRRPRPAIRCTTRPAPPTVGAVARRRRSTVAALVTVSASSSSAPPSVVASRRHLRPHFVGWRTRGRPQRPSSPGESGAQNARVTASEINRLHEISAALSTPPAIGPILRRGRRRTRAWAGRGGMDGS